MAAAVLTTPLRSDLRARAAYAEGAGIYRILPGAVATPVTTDELIRVLGWAREQGMPVIPRGAGSAMGGGNVGDGLVIDLCRLGERRVTVDPRSGLARAAAGATGAMVNAAAARHRLRLATNPSSLPFATSAGLVSTNAAGARSYRSGSVRRWVHGLDLVTADGERLELRRGQPPSGAVAAVRRFEPTARKIRAAAHVVRLRFPETRKNASGYALDAWLASGDLLDLFIGAEGTLGLVTEVHWNLEPVPEARGGLRVAVLDDGELMYALGVLRALKPSSIELLDRTFLRFVAGELSDATAHLALRAGALLLVEFEGLPEQVHEGLRAARGRLAPHVYEVTAGYGEAAIEALWAIRHAASPILAGLGLERRSLQVIEDGCVPVEILPRYLAALRTIPERHGVEAVIFGHAGDGHLHVNLLPDTTRRGWEETVRTIYDEVSAVQLALGGTPTGEHGDGRLRAGLVERLYGREIVEMFRAVKHAFDPGLLLNPGIILPEPREPRGEPPVVGPESREEHPVSRLKVGAAAAELPADIAAALREIEQRGNWNTDRMEIADRQTVRPSNRQ